MTKTTTRNTELRTMLTTRRDELLNDVRSRIRDGRSERPVDVGDSVEHSDADAQEDLGLALLQMRAETLARIDEALLRLDTGQYGSCFDCGREIAAQRLRALVFAVRCRNCEEERERDARAFSQRRSSLSAFPAGF